MGYIPEKRKRANMANPSGVGMRVRKDSWPLRNNRPAFVPNLISQNNTCKNKRHRICDDHRQVVGQQTIGEPEKGAEGEQEIHV